MADRDNCSVFCLLCSWHKACAANHGEQCLACPVKVRQQHFEGDKSNMLENSNQLNESRNVRATRSRF